MYYLLAFLLFVILVYVFVKLLSSLVKGCLVGVAVAIIISVAFVFIKSTKEPVSIFGYFVVDNLEVKRVYKLGEWGPLP